MSKRYAEPHMAISSHPHDRYDYELKCNLLKYVVTGIWCVVLYCLKGKSRTSVRNSAKTAFVSQFVVGLTKSKKRTRSPTRAYPMSLVMLHNMHKYVDAVPYFNTTVKLWFKALAALCFYWMCRISEVLTKRRKDVHRQLHHKHRTTKATILYGSFVLKDHKTDHDPTSPRVFNLYDLPYEE